MLTHCSAQKLAINGAAIGEVIDQNTKKFDYAAIKENLTLNSLVHYFVALAFCHFCLLPVGHCANKRDMWRQGGKQLTQRSSRSGHRAGLSVEALSPRDGFGARQTISRPMEVLRAATGSLWPRFQPGVRLDDTRVVQVVGHF